MSDDLRNKRTIHIDIPYYAPDAEVEAFEDAVAEFVLSWPHAGKWDPFMSSHAEACEDSDHCHGPGSSVHSWCGVSAEGHRTVRGRLRCMRTAVTDLLA